MGIYVPHHGFNEFNDDSFAHVIKFGAAKINKKFSASSLDRLSKGYYSQLPSLLNDQIPELNEFFSYLNISDNSKLNFDSLEIEGSPDYYDIDSHTDSGIQEGISLLIPTLGRKAWFLCSDNKFNFGDKVNYVTRYETGDGIVLRQKVNTINGIEFNFNPSTHLGASHFVRSLVIIDYLNPDLIINGQIS